MNSEEEILPTVAVVLCTYNGAAFLQQQLASVVKQTFTAMEIIVCDDASSDNTAAIVNEFAAKDKRIKFFVNEHNLGFTKNFEQAVKKSLAPLVAFCDQDDLWHPEKIEKLVAALPTTSPLIYCDTLRFSNEAINWEAKPSKKYRRFAGTDARKIAVFNTISGHAVLVRRSLLEGIFPFKEGVYYDWLAAVVASANGGVVFLPEVLVYQRVHTHNVSMSKGHDHHDKKHKYLFNAMVSRHLAAFATINSLKPQQQSFFITLQSLWNQAMQQSFSLPLFLFLVRHGKLVFHFKNKKFAFFSRMKHAYRLSSNTTQVITTP